jgi:molecular chaperone DnaK
VPVRERRFSFKPPRYILSQQIGRPTIRGKRLVTVEKFLEGLRNSGLMSADEVHAFMVSLPPFFGEPTVKSIAAELVRRGKLTKFQAGRIAAGRPEGLVLGKYVIQDKIGEGGMGEVFVAEHRRMKRPVVVKILPQHAVESVYAHRRFQREVEAAAQLHHPNIVTAYDADEEDGIHFLVMEFVDGQPLGDVVQREGPFTLEKSVLCLLQAARGLEYAHSKGIVHRDIKPNNLLLDRTGVVKVLDMGLARFDDGRQTMADLENDPDADSLTKDNQIVGTVEYMAPEQVDDSSGADRRSDIYSLGCTWFRLLTNRPPFAGETLVQTLLAHRTDPVPSLMEFRSDVPPSVDAILEKMLAKNPSERFQSMGEVITALEALLAEITGRPVSKPRHAPMTTKQSDSDAYEIDLDASGVRRSPSGTSVTLDMTSSESTAIRRKTGGSTARLPDLPTQAVGIDLGTTFSAIAYLDSTGRPTVVENTEGDKTTPSVVLLDGNEVIVGREAVKAMSTDWERIAECMKRDVGHPEYCRSVAGRKFPPEVLQACVLHKLRHDARRVLGDFNQVVITVPAYFDEVRRKSTQDAGYIAGIEVLDIINEPTAAALAYGYHRGQFLDLQTGPPKRLLVYDLGGGTFDVTVMEIAEGEFVTLATDGDVQLGGRDWDQRLVDFAAENFIRNHGRDPREDPNTYGRMLLECEDVKRTLSSRHKATLIVTFGSNAERIEITRERFEELTADLLERTAFTTRQTLRAATLDWSDIDVVLMVGGSTRMPAVAKMLRELSGREPDGSISPDETVAHGAAIHAGLLLQKLDGRAPKIRVRNVNSHSLGIVGTDPKTNRRQTAVLVPRNTPLPAKAKRVFRTSKDGQRSIVAQIVEGESSDPNECMNIGKCTIRGLPPDLSAGTPIEVRFQYEENGRLKVTVQVPGFSDRISSEITRDNNLSRKQLDEWRALVVGSSENNLEGNPRFA